MLKASGFAPQTIRILKDLLSDTQCRVKVGATLSELFAADGGVVQGAGESGSIFNLYMLFCVTPVLAELKKLGVTVEFRLSDGEYLRLNSASTGLSSKLVLFILMFVDDTALVARCPRLLQKALTLVNRQFTRFGLKLNAAKSELVHFNGAGARPCARPGCPCPLQGSTSKRAICSRCDSSFHLGCADCRVVPDGEWLCRACIATPLTSLVESVLHPRLVCGGVVLRWVEEFKYLGVTFAANCELDAELDRRLQLASGACAALRPLLRRGRQILGLGSVSQIFITLVCSVLLYGAESWALTTPQRLRLSRWTRRKLEQLTRGRRHIDGEQHADVRVPEFATLLARKQLRYLGHVARSEGGRYIKIIVSALRRGGLGVNVKAGLFGQGGLYAGLIEDHFTSLPMAELDRYFPRRDDDIRVRRWYDLAQRRGQWASFVNSVHAPAE